MIPRKVSFVVWTHCVLLSIAGVAASGQDFEVSGSMTLQSFTQSRRFTQHFEIAVSGCRALILSSNTDAHTGYRAMRPAGPVAMTNETDRVSTEVGIEDGTAYRLTRFFHEGKCDTAASIDAFEIPRDEVSGINYLWFAYASSCYFQQQTNRLLEPIWTLDDWQLKSQHFKEKADWSLNKGGPFLPRRAVYYSDGLLRHRTGGIASTNLAPPPYNHGFTNFTYEELSSTNSGGIEIPTEFRFIRYGFVGTGIPTPIFVVTGKIEKLAPGVSVSVFRPPFTGQINIVDNRHPSFNPTMNDFIYPAQDGNWADTNVNRIHRRELR
jgi:hypothetical protein